MRIVDPGHIYWIPNLESPKRPRWVETFACWVAPKLCRLFGGQAFVFIKRSSKMIQHPNEHTGSNTQELFRVTIDRSTYLDAVGESVETEDAIYHLRMALWDYEARAYRRKQQKLNKQAAPQAETGDINADRESWDDIPFSEYEIEDLPTGPDGHIIWKEKP